MPALTDTQIVDLITSTQKDLGRMKFQQVAQNFTDYEVMQRLMKKDKVRFDGGTGIQRTLMVTTSGAARHVGLYEPDATNVGDVLKTVNIPWRHTTTNYAFERREKAFNQGPAAIVNMVSTRRTDAMLSLIELMEASFWNKPEDSTDTTTPYGLPYWVVKNGTAGFNGGAPSGFTNGCADLIHPNWANYTGTYTTVSKADLIKKMRTAARKINFKSPVDVPDFRKGTGQKYRIYVNEETLSNLEDLGEAQNENLGRDLAPMDGTITFKRNPIVYVPYLDGDTSNPFYFLNFGFLYPVFLKGEYMRETEPLRSGTQHTVFVVHVDLSWNVLCVDRRRQAVLYVA